MKKRWFIIPLILLAVYFAGPKVDTPSEGIILPDVPSDLRQLEEIIRMREDTVNGMKPDNQARILWYDSVRKTPYAFVYLHGWSASYREGYPINVEIARRYGANLYLPRLYGHGTEDGDNFATLTADKLIKSAKEAIAIAAQLGDSVVIIGTSTGGTLALELANSSPVIAGLILYSPNIRIYDKSAWMLDKPWGVQIGRLVTGSNYHEWEADGERKQYWTSKYRLSALAELQALVDHTMNEETFSAVHKPVFVGCYYKNDSLQDNTVSVEAILEMYEQLGSSRKELVKFPDVGHHVMASEITSEDLESVRQETRKFLEEVMQLKPFIPQTEASAIQNGGTAAIPHQQD